MEKRKKWIDNNPDYNKIYYLNNKEKFYRKLTTEQRRVKREKAKELGHYKAVNNYNVIVKKRLPVNEKICQICGSTNVEFHHFDYSKWYEGYQLCQKHHREAHKKPEILKDIKAKNYNYLVKRPIYYKFNNKLDHNNKK